ncbi:MAG: HTTM domain-containing protein [Acidimicrobiia bacterium]|nr:HTTM domain-containing protein [Acidimicrobiia bacterium]
MTWNRFWFEPRPVSTLTLFRISLGVALLCWFVSLSWDLESFFGSQGLRPGQTYGGERIGLLKWVEADAAIWALWATGLVTSLLVIAGRLVRLAAPLVWFCVMSLWLDNTGVWNAGDDLLRAWALYFGIFALVTPAAFLSVGAGGRDRSFPAGPHWVLRLVQIQITVIYPASVIGKVSGGRWWDGTASLYALGLEDFQRFWVPDFVRENLVVGAVFTWYTLLVEALLSILLWVPRTRRIAIVAGLTMHFGFQYTMRLGFFAWAITIGYIAFLTPTESRRILSWLWWPVAALRPAPSVPAPDPV